MTQHHETTRNLYLMIWPVSVYLSPFAFSDSHLFVQLAHTIITVYVKVSNIFSACRVIRARRGHRDPEDRKETRSDESSVELLSFCRRAARDSDPCLCAYREIKESEATLGFLAT